MGAQGLLEPALLGAHGGFLSSPGREGEQDQGGGHEEGRMGLWGSGGDRVKGGSGKLAERAVEGCRLLSSRKSFSAARAKWMVS